MDGLLRLLNLAAHALADKIERDRAADAATLAAIRTQYAKDRATIEGTPPPK